MALTTNTPTPDELVRRIAEMAPVLRKHGAWAEDNRRLPDEVIGALADVGVFKMRVPRRYGGYESDTRTLIDVAAELARADGATAWTASVYWIPTWMVGMFPAEVQDEVFATPDVRVCGTLSPSAIAMPAEDGVVVNGEWGFMTGAWHSHWQEIIAVLVGAGGEPYPIVALVPVSDLQLVDDWHTSGLRGTGSISTVAKDVFVPARRVLPLHVVLAGRPDAAEPMYRAPLLPVASVSAVGNALGLAQAGLHAFLDRLPDRKITYTSYDSQRTAPLTHHQVADATMKVDEAAFHAYRLSDTVDAKCATGEEWSLLERVRARGDLGSACRLGKEAVDLLATASGGSSIYQDVPIQRIARDIQAVNLHALMHPNTNSELYGRVLCGLEPNTQYL